MRAAGSWFCFGDLLVGVGDVWDECRFGLHPWKWCVVFGGWRSLCVGVGRDVGECCVGVGGIVDGCVVGEDGGEF